MKPFFILVLVLFSQLASALTEDQIRCLDAITTTNTRTIDRDSNGNYAINILQNKNTSNIIQKNAELTHEFFLDLINASLIHIQKQISLRASTHGQQINHDALNSIDQLCPRE